MGDETRGVERPATDAEEAPRQSGTPRASETDPGSSSEPSEPETMDAPRDATTGEFTDAEEVVGEAEAETDLDIESRGGGG